MPFRNPEDLRTWRQGRKHIVSAENAAQYAAKRLEIRAKQKAYYQAHLGDARRRHLKAKYGITPERYDQLLVAQGGVCAICGDPPGEEPLAVDHDHATGEVRGLLCGQCNKGLGCFEDNPQFLESASVYLKEHGHETVESYQNTPEQ